MNNIDFTHKKDYLLVSIEDKTITFPRAKEILTRIGVECDLLGCQKVLLDERSVKKREVTPPKIMKLSKEVEEVGLREVHLAFLCQPHLIDKDSDRLRLFTYQHEYIIQHFSKEEEAIGWLKSAHK